MYLVISVALFGTVVLLFTALYLANRMPEVPRWAGEELVAYFWGVLLVGMFALGVGYALETALRWETIAFGEREAAMIAAELAVFFALWKWLGARRRLARYARMASETPAPVIPITEAVAEASRPGADEAPPPPRAA